MSPWPGAGSIILAERATASLRFAYAHPAHAIALMGGIGAIPFAPGTFGTLAAIPLHVAMVSHLGVYPHLLVLGALFLAGVWAAERTSRDLGVPDHGGIVVDETVAFLCVLFLTPDGVVWLAVAFLLFRLFDIFKPPPIRYFERTVPGGVGVMFDDLLAAGYALLCLAALKAFLD